MVKVIRHHVALVHGETTKLLTAVGPRALALATVAGTWPMAWLNAASAGSLSSDDPRLYSAVPVPAEYAGFDMAGFGYVLVVALAALWAGGEYDRGRLNRTTLLATPRRLSVILAKVGVLAVAVTMIAFLSMWGAVLITHAVDPEGVDPGRLNPAIWQNLGGVTIAWTLTAEIAFAIGVLARTAIVPLIVMVPQVIGLGDFLAGLWPGGRYLPVAAGASLYSDPALGNHLDPLPGGLVLGATAIGALVIAAIVFVRRDA